jgi:hypothetical protein
MAKITEGQIRQWDKPVKIVQSYVRLGFELQKLSESLTLAHYMTVHPSAKVSLRHVREGDSVRIFITLDSRDYAGHVYYGDVASDIIRFAHTKLLEGGYLQDAQAEVEEKWAEQ